MAPDYQDSMESYCRRLQSPGRSLTGGRTPDRESRSVAEAISVIIVDQFHGVSRSTDELASRRVGTGVQAL